MGVVPLELRAQVDELMAGHSSRSLIVALVLFPLLSACPSSCGRRNERLSQADLLITNATVIDPGSADIMNTRRTGGTPDSGPYRAYRRECLRTNVLHQPFRRARLSSRSLFAGMRSLWCRLSGFYPAGVENRLQETEFALQNIVLAACRHIIVIAHPRALRLELRQLVVGRFCDTLIHWRPPRS